MKSTPHTIKPWFAAVFAAVMLLVCVMVAASAVTLSSLRREAADISGKTEAALQRLAKQEYEFGQIEAELPLKTEELALKAPQAEALSTREDELRQQRKDLRKENKELAKTIESLEEQLSMTDGQ